MQIRTMYSNCLIVSFMVLCGVLFQDGLSMECPTLESGDVSNFDIRKYSVRYELVMGILREGPFSKVPFNCNGVSIKQHSHPDGGVNVALTFEGSDKKTVLDTFLAHMKSPTDTYGFEVDGFHRSIQKWTDSYFNAILATEDLLAFTVCIKNEDDDKDSDFVAFILRKENSNLPISQIQAMLPESVKNNPGLKALCDN